MTTPKTDQTPPAALPASVTLTGEQFALLMAQIATSKPNVASQFDVPEEAAERLREKIRGRLLPHTVHRKLRSLATGATCTGVISRDKLLRLDDYEMDLDVVRQWLAEKIEDLPPGNRMPVPEFKNGAELRNLLDGAVSEFRDQFGKPTKSAIWKGEILKDGTPVGGAINDFSHCGKPYATVRRFFEELGDPVTIHDGKTPAALSVHD